MHVVVMGDMMVVTALLSMIVISFANVAIDSADCEVGVLNLQLKRP